MKLENTDDVKKYLAEAGIADKSDMPLVQPLTGGVSCRVWKINVSGKCYVLKQALKKLHVKADWFSDVERIHREHEVMAALNELLPENAIPKVLHTDYTEHIYMMECAENANTWKDVLMSGEFNISHAENAASLLRQIHGQSNRMSAENKTKFKDQKYFIQLRIEPFHRYVMQKYPELSSSIQNLINDVTLNQIYLVHGDFSPKNMLVKKTGKIVLIDFEVAHWGNPVFDLAFCLGHLMLKGWHLNKHEEALKLIDVFLKVYDKKTENLIPHLGLMLLARMDGKSPVNYITDERMKNIIRNVAVGWIKSPLNAPTGSFAHMLNEIQQRFIP